MWSESQMSKGDGPSRRRSKSRETRNVTRTKARPRRSGAEHLFVEVGDQPWASVEPSPELDPRGHTNGVRPCAIPPMHANARHAMSVTAIHAFD